MSFRLVARIAIGVIVSLVALLLVARSADLPAAVGRVLVVDARSLLLPVLVVMIQLGIRSVRWAGLLTAAGSRPIRAPDAVGPLAVGYLGNTVLPARLGEVVRIVLISRRAGVPATTATASVIVERGVDLIALLTIATAASGLSGVTSWLPCGVVVALLVAVGVVLPLADRIAARLPRRLPLAVLDVINRLLRAFATARPPVVARAWMLSLLAWSCDALVIWLCASAVGVPLSPGIAVLIAAGAAVGAALPAAAGYLGTYELGAMTMAGVAGVAADAALQVALLGHAIAVLPLALVGLMAVAVMAAEHAKDPGARDVPDTMASSDGAAGPAGR